MPIPLAIPIGMAAAGLITQVIGGAKSGQKMKEASNLVNQQVTDLNTWYDTEKNRNFLDSNLGSSIFNRIVQNVEDQNKINASTAAVTGASDASVLAGKADVQKQAGEVVSQLASYGTQKETQLDQQYQANKNQLMGQKVNIATGQAANAGKLTETGGNLIGAAGGLFMGAGGAGGEVIGGGTEGILAGADTNLMA